MNYLILGGTGTLGQEMASRLLRGKKNKVTIFSRCELKQKQMGANSKLSFILGDIRDRSHLLSSFRGFDVVFHFAALKHIDWLETNPEESIKTNILGTINVADAAIEAGVKHVVFSSTDKAVDPINAYGMCKGLSEKILLNKNRLQNNTKFSVYRWGNILGSRGSAIAGFAKSLKEEQKVFITDPKMTRFWLRIEDAVEFVLKTYQTAPSHEVLIPPLKAAPLKQVIAAIARILGVNKYKLEVIGLRPGEKVHEAMRSMCGDDPFASDFAPEYDDEELEALLHPILKGPIAPKEDHKLYRYSWWNDGPLDKVAGGSA